MREGRQREVFLGTAASAVAEKELDVLPTLQTHKLQWGTPAYVEAER